MLLSEYDAVRHIKSEKELSYQEGYDSGFDSGIETGMKAFIKQLSILKLSTSDICKALCENFTLTEDQALACINKYTAE